MRKILLLTIIVMLSTLLAGCGQQINSVTFDGQTEVDGYREFTSSRHYTQDQAVEISAELEEYFKSGDHNILRIQTKYTFGNLTYAKVYYSNQEGKGELIRAKFFVSTTVNAEARDRELRPQYDQFLTTVQLVDEIQISNLGYMSSVEVYYTEAE